MQLILWVLPVLGTTLIVTCSTLFRPLREHFQHLGLAYQPERLIGELLSCPMCLGFWAGLAYSIFIPLNTHPYLGWFFDACTASYVCWVSHVVLCALGQGRLLSSRPDLKGK